MEKENLIMESEKIQRKLSRASEKRLRRYFKYRNGADIGSLGFEELNGLTDELAKEGEYLADLLFSTQVASRERISQMLRLLSFYRRLFSKLFVKNLCLIVRTCKILICGKGIEGFIPYKTWARPPSKAQLVTIVSIFIDKLSRPGNAYTEMCYAS